MQRRNHLRLAAGLTAAMLLVAACSDDKKDSSPSTAAAASSTAAPASSDSTTESSAATESSATESSATESSATESSAAGGDAWKVDTDDCVDPAAATAKIEGEVKIGSIMPLSNSPAAAAFSPVKDGLEAYIKYANEQKMLGDVTLSVSVEDDQYNKDLTSGAASKLIDGGANLLTGVIGSPNNLAIRDVMNSDCIPQLMNLTGAPEWGEPEEFPWTTGGLVPYDIESKIYAKDIAKEFPSGSKVAMYTVASEFGQVYAEAFKSAAADAKMDIVEEQTVEATDNNPPKTQVTAIAAQKPDVVMAVPLGAGCITFLKELDAAKAANPGWNPRTYLTNTCASPLILGATGAPATGLITTAYLKNVTDPKFASDPKVKPYLDYMAGLGLSDKASTAAVGWTIGEVTVHILQQAAKSPDGLTRASIMDAARNFEFTPQLAIDGLTLKMDGDKDAYQMESLQLEQYDAATGLFTMLGDLDTSFES